MSDIFIHGEQIECPTCKHNHCLSVIEKNYSGCSVDLAYCEECGKGWGISYKVAKISRFKECDQESKSERLKREKLEKIKEEKETEISERETLKRLKEKYEKRNKK